MTRPQNPDQRPTGEELPDSADADSGGSLAGAVRKAALALGVFALVLVVVRRVRSSGGAPVVGDTGAGHDRDSSDDTYDISFDESAETAAREAGESARPDDEELPGTDRSAEEIEERAEDDVEETPAEPGEMTVDEDVVDDVVDGDVESGEESSTDDRSE